MSPRRDRGCLHQHGYKCAECLRHQAELRRARDRAKGMRPNYALRVAVLKDPVEKAYAETEPEWYWPELAR